MKLKLLKSIHISMDTFNITDFITRLDLDPTASAISIEDYHVTHLNESRLDPIKICEHILDQVMPYNPYHISVEGSTIKIDLYDKPKTNQVLVTLDGGVIQHIQAVTPVDVLVMDFDIDGVEEKDLSYINEGEFLAYPYPVQISEWDVETVQTCYKEYKEQQKEQDNE